MALLRKKKTIEEYEKALVHYVMNEAKTKEDPNRSYAVFEGLIRRKNEYVGYYIAGLNEFAGKLTKKDREESNDRVIFKALEKRHRRPVEKPIKQPIRLLHELLFLPHLMHYFKKSDESNFKWRLVAQLNEDVLAVHYSNASDFFLFEECFAKP